jgi:galactokinase
VGPPGGAWGARARRLVAGPARCISAGLPSPPPELRPPSFMRPPLSPPVARSRYNLRVVECCLAAALLARKLGAPPQAAAAVRTLRQVEPDIARRFGPGPEAQVRPARGGGGKAAARARRLACCGLPGDAALLLAAGSVHGLSNTKGTPLPAPPSTLAPLRSWPPWRSCCGRGLTSRDRWGPTLGRGQHGQRQPAAPWPLTPAAKRLSLQSAPPPPAQGSPLPSTPATPPPQIEEELGVPLEEVFTGQPAALRVLSVVRAEGFKLRARARHVYSEAARVLAFKAAAEVGARGTSAAVARARSLG